MSSFAGSGDDALFVERVKQWMFAALQGDGPATFGQLVAELPGVDPSVVRNVLQGVAKGDGSLRQTAAALLEDCRASTPTWARTLDRPVPHPLDYFWAYDDESIALISTGLEEVTAQGGTVIYLGTPNAFDSCADALPDRQHVLLDRRDFTSLAVASSNRSFQPVDLLHGSLPGLGGDIAIIDPPWYPNEMRGFLWAARATTRSNAEIWMSSPPPGARPKADSEVESVVGWALDVGIELLERRPGAMRYRSPPFELASHRAAGLGGVPIDWRTGDLLRFRVRERGRDERPVIADDGQLWELVVVNEIPICLRGRSVTSGPIAGDLLRPVVPGDILETVSRRSLARNDVDVWTSLNRVWSSPHPSVLAAICESIPDGGKAEVCVEARLGRTISSSEQEHVRRAVDHVREIVRLEREEHGI